MRRRTITLAAFVPLAVAVFVYSQWSSASTFASREPLQRDYSKFSHTSKSHQQLSCGSCHKVPTANWRQTSAFPDVTDYPDHDSCVKCHRQQFYRSARPAICSVCHTRVSPRDDARFPFPKSAGSKQFTIEFPHDRHQDVIASNRPRLGTSEALRPSPAFVTAHGYRAYEREQSYNNCTICHQTNQMRLKPPPGGWIDSFVPPLAAFKTVPTNHASCFNCHWKGQEPVRSDCGGCHKISTSPITGWPGNRISPKFTHEREQHVAECTTCHINITAATTLKGLKPDVPIASCAPCHRTSTDKDIVTIETEVERRNKSSAFVCAKCHTSDIGMKAVPLSHSVLFSR